MSAVPQVPANSLPAPRWSWGGAPADARAAERAGAARARRRGVLQGGAGLAVAAVLWLAWRTPLAWVVAAVALALALLAAAAPLTAYARVSRALETFGRWVGTAVTWLLMGLLFYGLFLPVGLVLRARRSLRLTTGFDPQAPSYWKRPAARSGGAERYQKQF
jgi:hypothetical protein